MPRTLPAELQAAMDSGSYDPYLKALVLSNTDKENPHVLDVLSFKIQDMQAECVIAPAGAPETIFYFALQRGAWGTGAPAAIRSSYYRVTSVLRGPRGVTLKGCILPLGRFSYSNSPQITYADLIRRLVGDLGWSLDKYVDYEDPGAAWLGYYFYPPGRSISLANMQGFFGLCRQKYLLFFVDSLSSGTDNGTRVIQATTPRAKDYDICDPLLQRETELTSRRFTWKDEGGAVHYSGPVNLPVHNLGYIDSVHGAAPALQSSPQLFRSSKLPVHLKYQTGDCARLGSDAGYFQGRIRVTEVFDPHSTPSWYNLVEPLVWFDNTEGGAVPETVANNAPYMPLSTGYFGGVLSAADTNLQAAMETLDDHRHAGAASAVDYNSLSNLPALPAAEIQSVDIFRCLNAGGSSAWTGTLAALPGGAALTVTTASGVEAALKPWYTNALGKMRLYNLSRGDFGRITAHDTATHVLTLDAEVPPGWQAGDSLSIASQTCVGGYAWVDIELTSGPVGRQVLLLNTLITSATPGDMLRLQPFEAYSSSKSHLTVAQVNNVQAPGFGAMKINSNLLCLAWTGNPTLVAVREAGYLG